MAETADAGVGSGAEGPQNRIRETESERVMIDIFTILQTLKTKICIQEDKLSSLSTKMDVATQDVAALREAVANFVIESKVSESAELNGEHDVREIAEVKEKMPIFEYTIVGGEGKKLLRDEEEEGEVIVFFKGGSLGATLEAVMDFAAPSSSKPPVKRPPGTPPGLSLPCATRTFEACPAHACQRQYWRSLKNQSHSNMHMVCARLDALEFQIFGVRTTLSNSNMHMVCPRLDALEFQVFGVRTTLNIFYCATCEHYLNGVEAYAKHMAEHHY